MPVMCCCFIINFDNMYEYRIECELAEWLWYECEGVKKT